MSNKDKGSIVSLFGIATIIFGSIFLSRYVTNLPWILVVGVLLIMQYGFLLPNLCKNWYKVNQLKAGIWQYVPLVNEIQMFDRTPAILASVLTGICGLVLALLLVPSNVLESVLGVNMAMEWGFNVVAIFIILIVITNFVYAFGLCGVLRAANEICYEQLKIETTKMEVIYYLMLMLPFIRICGLFNLRDKINSLIAAHVGYKDESQFVLVEEQGKETM